MLYILQVFLLEVSGGFCQLVLSSRPLVKELLYYFTDLANRCDTDASV